MPHAVADRVHPHAGERPKIVHKEAKQRSTGRRTELSFFRSRLNRQAAQKTGGGRSRNRQQTVSTANIATADTDFRGDNALRRKFLHQQTDHQYVGDSVHLPQLMKMDLLHANTVDSAFRLGNAVIDCQRVLPSLLADCHSLQNGLDSGQI